MSARIVVLTVLIATPLSEATAGKRKNPYRLPSVDIRQRVLWGAECRRPDGRGLAFGGQDQESGDGRPHTRVLVDGQWKAVHGEFRAANPLQKLCARTWKLRDEAKDIRAAARALYFHGLAPEEESRRIEQAIRPRQEKLAKALRGLVEEVDVDAGLDDYAKGQVRFARGHLNGAAGLWRPLAEQVTPKAVQAMRAAQVHLELAAEAFDAEPPARALSPVVHDPKTRLYVLFGGDHLDYLTNDTWVFDPAAGKWFQRHPAAAPAPRANHTLTAGGDGKVKLAGGYTYASNTDYCGGQYLDIDDGEFIYDLGTNTWQGGKLVPADSRIYRTGPFHPDFYLQGEKPGAAAFEARLAKLPANTWVATDPPYRPRLNRDWGTAVIDTHRDMILRWSGGHSAHGGTDVPHFHLATNRWELAYPVEFPLGQLYSNTSYPKGCNFNRRPGMTGHTYQNYACDPVSRTMVQTGHPDHFYVYDPDRADWVGRGIKPGGMRYGSCFYTLTLCPTPKGVVCWTKDGRLFCYEAARSAWTEMKTIGEKLPGARVDNSTLAYDPDRDRVLFFVKPYGEPPYDGQVWSMDLKTRRVGSLSPTRATEAARIAWIDRCCLDPGSELVLFATFLKEAQTGWSRTPAYDCAANRWVSLDLKYAASKAWSGWRRAFPHGHSAGVVYDPKRKLIWGTDTDSQVYVLKLDAKAADVKPL
jgi:hypothetical protein